MAPAFASTGIAAGSGLTGIERWKISLHRSMPMTDNYLPELSLGTVTVALPKPMLPDWSVAR